VARGWIEDVKQRRVFRALIGCGLVSFEIVEAHLATRPAVVAGLAPWALLRLGRTARALEVIESGPTGNDAVIFSLLWGTHGAAARSSPEFPEFLRRTGLADLWEREGPPDLCRRVGPRDHACR
jgi:hypothetical protein